ncbi:leucine-rich repeat-containing protein 24 isoform X2 [Orussus abietinus]|nr:leucine-rich repeat-containing protein 24 isoform X2 [Orussus abietinus]XP_023288936.1 leucine-rich repeat-containing protein 24 isoform X2 [Orussus abietinus]
MEAIAKFLGLMMMAAACLGQEDWQSSCEPCKCKWVSGKKTAECIKENLTNVPNSLSPDIQILDLTGNRIGHVGYEAFSRVSLVNLQKLVLRECGIEAVHVEAFKGLKIVIEIDLSANRIKTLHPGTFAQTQRLRVLLLNQNQVRSLENGLFHDLEYLQKVVLSNNRLERIGEETFRNLPGLQTLTLDGNELSNVKLQSFEGLPRLGSLELHNNPWNCNCHLKNFRDWTIERKLYTKPTTCKQPTSLVGKMWDEVSSDEFACRPRIVSLGPAPRLEVDNGDVQLTCRIDGIPRPKVTWYHRSRAVRNGTRRHGAEARTYFIKEAYDWSNLTLGNVTLSDKGDYVCVATSPGGRVERNVTLSIIGDAIGSKDHTIGLPLALGFGVIALLLLLVSLVLCLYYCRRRRTRHDEKAAEAASLEHHGMGEQEKSLITAINPVVKPPRRYEAPSVTSHGTEMTELNRTLLDNESVFAGGIGGGVGVADDEREGATPELDRDGTLTRGTSYRQYPPDLLAFSGGRGASPTSQASTIPDTSRTNHLPGPFGSPSSSQYSAAFKTLPHNRSGTPFTAGVPPVMPRHGYVTIPRRPRAPSWSSGPPTSPGDTLEPVYDNLGLRTTADGSSKLSLNKSPEPGNPRSRVPLTATPVPQLYGTIQRSTPNILGSSSPVDRSAPEGAPEWPSKVLDEVDTQSNAGTLGRKVPPQPPPKPKKRTLNGPLYEDEGEDGTEV